MARLVPIAFSLLLVLGCGGSEQAATESGEAPRISADQISEILRDSNVVFLDVREAEEIEELGTLEGYVHIPIDELESRLDELPKDRPILTA